MKKINKYDFIIYICLFSAIICLIIGSKQYFSSLNEKSTIKDEVKSAIKEINGEKINIETSYEEIPSKLKDYNPNEIIKNYIDNLVDGIKKDNTLPYSILSTWESYEVLDSTYIREVAQNYYEYKTNIKITNSNAKLPCDKNKELSKEEYNVITLSVYIKDLAPENGYIVKKIDT